MFRYVNCTEYWCIHWISMKQFIYSTLGYKSLQNAASPCVRIILHLCLWVGAVPPWRPSQALLSLQWLLLEVCRSWPIEREIKQQEGSRDLIFFPPEWWEFCLYLNLINLNESEGTKVIRWGRRDGDRENIDNKELRETIWGFLPPSTVLLLCGGRKYECKMLLNSSWHKTSISVVHSGHLDSLDTNITTDLCVTII